MITTITGAGGRHGSEKEVLHTCSIAYIHTRVNVNEGMAGEKKEKREDKEFIF